MRTNLALALFCVLLTACGTIYTGVVTLTSVMDDAAKSYAKSYNDGLVPPEVHVKASLAFAEYNKAAGIARRTFEAVKAGQSGDTKAALEAARGAANHFVDVIFPVLPPPKVGELRTQLAKAGAP